MALDENQQRAAGQGDNGNKNKKRKRKRWGDAVKTPETTETAATATSSSSSGSNRVQALQESIRARLAAAKAKQAQTIAPTAAASGGDATERPAKRAKQFELDLTVTGPTFRQQDTKKGPAPKKINPYLAHLETTTTTTTAEEDDHLTRASKPRPRNKEIRFNEPGHWQEVAERKREKAAQAAAAGYVSGRKAGHTLQSAGLGEIYGRGSDAALDDDDDFRNLAPRADANPDTKMPQCMEWWDMELLPSKLRKEVAATESQALSRQTKAALNKIEASNGVAENTEKKEDDDTETLRSRCVDQAALSYSKTAALVQHIVPIRPPNARDNQQVQPVLHLTKKELKRQRKLRRQEKQRELQDLQSAGLLPAPEPRLTLRNFIQVLGDQAFVDPSQMEQKVMEQVQARQRAHLERNEANKLTKEQRAAKRERKIQEDTTTGVSVAVFFVKDMSHPYHRAKVDLNAQQYKISGGVLECQHPPLACVICEGGPKAIKKYIRLMTVRMKWQGPDDAQDVEDEEDEEEDAGEYKTQKFNPNNRCDLVWQGMAVKPAFRGFFFQSCESSDQARKLLKNKGVAHYWDQALEHASGKDSGLQLKLTSKSGDDDEESMNPYEQADNDEDVKMMDE